MLESWSSMDYQVSQRPSHAWPLTSIRDTPVANKAKAKKKKNSKISNSTDLSKPFVFHYSNKHHIPTPVPPQSLQILYTTALWTTFHTPTPSYYYGPSTRHDPPPLFNHFETISQNVINAPPPSCPKSGKVRKRYQEALTQEFILWFGIQHGLDAWHWLCGALRITPLPSTM